MEKRTPKRKDKSSYLTRKRFLSILLLLYLIIPFCTKQSKDTPLKKTAPSDTISVNIPSFLGNSQRRFYGKGPVPEKLDVIWKTNLGHGKTKVRNKTKIWCGTGWTGQPVLVEDNHHPYLVIGAFDWSLRKIDALTGETVWRYKFDDVIKGSPTVFVNPKATTPEKKIVIFQGSRMGFRNSMNSNVIPSYRAISFKTGKELWRLNISKTDSYSRDVDGSGLVLGNLLYLGAENGVFYIINPVETVKKDDIIQPKVIKTLILYAKEDIKRHRRNLVTESSPAVSGDRVYVTAGSGHVYGIDTKLGEIVWDFYIGADLDSTPAVTRDGFLMVAVEKQYIPGKGGVFKLDPRKKPQDAVVWYFPTGNRRLADWYGGVIGSAAINDEYNPAGEKPSLAVFTGIDGYLYVVSQDEIEPYKVYGPDRKKKYPTPKLVWKKNIGSSISTPIIVDDHIISAGYDLKVHVFKIDHFKAGKNDKGAIKSKSGALWRINVKEIADFQAQGTFESTPIVWNGRIYIGCRDGYLYCLGANNK